MSVFRLLYSEFVRLAANKTVLASVVAAMLVPVVYGGILLSPKWGPYDNLSNLPVAVVNNDKGTVSEGKPIHVGNDLVKNLKEGKALGWEFVDSGRAMKGLQNNDFYMVIIIPEDFSERVTSVLEPDPQKLELEFVQNEGLNFLAAQVTKTATERIREQLANTITEQYVTTLFSSLEDISEGFEKAADGSAQLADGTTQLHNGTTELYKSVTGKTADIARLADGANELKAGTGLLVNSLSSKQSDITKLANGAQELYGGAIKLHDGTNEVLAGLQKAEPGSKKLREGFARLAPGSQKVAKGTADIQSGAVKLADGAERLVAGLEEYRNVNPTVRVGPYYQEIIDGAKAISAGLQLLSTSSVTLKDGAAQVADGLAKAEPGAISLHEGLKKLVEGQTKIVQGAAKLEAGAKQIADGNAAVDQGWKSLTEGASKIDTGMAQVSNGTSSVNDGWRELAAGATKLNDGAGKVNDGSKELASGLKEGAEQTGGLNLGEKNSQMFASPVELVGDKVNEYEHYRDSTAPYILTLALFVGILIMSLFIDFKKSPEISSLRWFSVMFMKLAFLGMAQAMILVLVVLFALKLSVDSLLGFILFALVISVVFSAIVLFLVAIGGNIGRFIALAFVILQLSTTGANLPIEMLPENLRSLSEYLPFTYSIAGFKSFISLDNFWAGIANMGILLGYLAVFTVLSLTVFFFKNKNQKQDSTLAF